MKEVKHVRCYYYYYYYYYYYLNIAVIELVWITLYSLNSFQECQNFLLSFL